MTVQSAVLAPGGNSSVEVPALMFARLAVQRRDGFAHSITWDLGPSLDFRDQRERVLAQVATAVDQVRAVFGTAPVVIGKSLGSLAAPLVADRGLAAIWFTPLLRDEPTAAALKRATGPCLLVGGTGDWYWDSSAARATGAEVIEIDGANHALVVPGRLAESAAALGRAITAVEDFLDQVVWASQ